MAVQMRRSWLLALAGAVVGGAIGSWLFLWLVTQGLYGLALPGALLGLGCGYGVPRRSLAAGALCGFAALILGVYCEWRFAGDPSFGHFVRHIADTAIATKLMIVLGAGFAFWFGLGRSAT